MHALAQLCQSNHSNQELVADEGGIELACDLLRMLVTPQGPASPSAAAAAAAAAGGAGTGAGDEAAAALETAAATAASAAAALAAGAPSPALAAAAAFPAVVDAVLRLLGALLEFNATNQKLVRWVLR